MEDRLTLIVGNVERSKDFYDAILRPLGFECKSAQTGLSAIYGTNGSDGLEIRQSTVVAISGTVAFEASDRETVDRCYAAAVAIQGKKAQESSLTLRHHPDYYAAYIFDPDAHNIAIVHREKAPSSNA